MEKATNNIKDPKVRAYFDDVTEGKTPAIHLTADEYEQGVQQFDEGAYSGDTRSPIPVISVHSVGNLQYRRQS